jgi:hypothetical protein
LAIERSNATGIRGGATMFTQTITTSYEWEAERIADELRHEDAVIIGVDGHTVTVRGLSWTLEAGHVRAICSVVDVAHATLDGVEVVCGRRDRAGGTPW